MPLAGDHGIRVRQIGYRIDETGDVRLVLTRDDGTKVDMADPSNYSLAQDIGDVAYPMLKGFTGDMVTDESDVFNSMGNNSGEWQLPKIPLLCKKQIVIPKNTAYRGWGSTVSASADGSTGIPFGIIFDPASIMPYGNIATVHADGSNWIFTIKDVGGTPVPHGCSVGKTFSAYGFVNAAFNRPCVIAATTLTTITVNNATVPAADDNGFVAPHLIRIGDVDQFAPNSRLEACWVECRSIPGSIGVYTSSVQENGGLRMVTFDNAMYRAGVFDGTDPFGTGKTALNYLIHEFRSIGSTNAKPDYRGLKLKGGNISIRGLDGITCVGGGVGANKPVNQVQVDGMYSGLFSRIHTENASGDGLLIGDESACHGAVFIGITGNASIGGCAVRVSNAVVNRVKVMAVMANSSVGGALNDQALGVIFPGEITSHTVGGTVVAGLGSGTDKNVLVGQNNDLVTATLAVGLWDVTGAGLLVPAAGTTSAEMRIVSGTAIATAGGIRSAQFHISGTQPISAMIRSRFLVTTAGTVVLRFFAAGATAVAKAATTVNAAPDATGIFARAES